MAGRGVTRRQFGLGVAASVPGAGSTLMQPRIAGPESFDATTAVDGGRLPPSRHRLDATAIASWMADKRCRALPPALHEGTSWSGTTDTGWRTCRRGSHSPRIEP